MNDKTYGTAMVYLWLLKIVNSKMWLPVYRRSLRRNSFVFTAQNTVIRDRFSYEFMGGVLDGKVVLHPLWVNEGKIVEKAEARRLLGIPQDAFIFLVFGNVHVGKDIITPFKALKSLNDSKAFILQAGDDRVLNTDLNDVQSLARSEGVSDRVISHNWYIPEDKKHLYFSASDVCILPYHGNFASTASVLWETVGFKKPIIASDIGDMGKMVRMYSLGLVYSPNDSESLADAMMRAMKYSFQVRDFGFDQFIRDYSSDAWAKQCIGLYERL
jgi:glycosyltransferase involved in cell wall biosynthesis